jgi:REP element-mobilizing transposase RayT
VAHSYVKVFVHYVFSTKEREPLISPEIQPRLFPYLMGIAEHNGMRALAVGGVEDRVHALVQLPATLSVAKGVQLLKGSSSRWMGETHPEAASAGRRGMVDSPSVSHRSTARLPISGARQSTTASSRSRKSSCSFSRPTV